MSDKVEEPTVEQEKSNKTEDETATVDNSGLAAPVEGHEESKKTTAKEETTKTTIVTSDNNAGVAAPEETDDKPAESELYSPSRASATSDEEDGEKAKADGVTGSELADKEEDKNQSQKKKRKLPFLPELGQPGGRDDPRRVGLNGADVRWYLRFLSENIPPDEARKKALERKKPPPTEVVESGSSHETTAPDTKPAVRVKPPKIKRLKVRNLRGASRKWFVRYKKRGMTRDEALCAVYEKKKEKLKIKALSIPFLTEEEKARCLTGTLFRNRTPYAPPRGRPRAETLTESLPVVPKAPPVDIKKDRLSGAARKRLQYLLAKGVPRDEAKIQALNPMHVLTGRSNLQNYVAPVEMRNVPVAPLKRGPPESVIPENESKKTRWQENTECREKTTQSVSAKQAVPYISKSTPVSLKVNITHTEHPDVKLTEEELTKIQMSIIDMLAGERESNINPSFTKSTFEEGYMSFICADQPTVDWLLKTGKQLKPWEGASLKAVVEHDLSLNKNLTVFLPGSELFNDDRILQVMKCQNHGLFTDMWRVVKRSREEGKPICYTLSVDPASINTLKSTNFRASYLFGKITFRLA